SMRPDDQPAVFAHGYRQRVNLLRDVEAFTAVPERADVEYAVAMTCDLIAARGEQARPVGADQLAGDRLFIQEGRDRVLQSCFVRLHFRTPLVFQTFSFRASISARIISLRV